MNFEAAYTQAIISKIKMLVYEKLSTITGMTAACFSNTMLVEFDNLFKTMFEGQIWRHAQTAHKSEGTNYLKYQIVMNTCKEIDILLSNSSLFSPYITFKDDSGTTKQVIVCACADVHMSFGSEDYERYRNFYEKEGINPLFVSCAVINEAPALSSNLLRKKKAKIQNLAVVQIIVLEKITVCAYLDGKKKKETFFKVFLPNQLGKLVRIVSDAELLGDVGYLPSKWVAFMRRLNPFIDYRVRGSEELGKLKVVLHAVVSTENNLDWDTSRMLVPSTQTQVLINGPDEPDTVACPPGFNAMPSPGKELLDEHLSAGILKGKDILFKFDPPFGWQLCRITKHVVGNGDYNYEFMTVSDSEKIFVHLRSELYSIAESVCSSSWCILRKLVQPPDGFALFHNRVPTQQSLDGGYLVGRALMFKFSCGWTKADVFRFYPKDPLPYRMMCEDDGSIQGVLFDLEKYSTFEDSDIGSWCLLSENLKM